MLNFSLFSLRGRAIILVLLAILPLLALTLFSYFDQRAQDIREVQRRELVAARNLATVQETVLSDSRKLLASLAQLPQVQRHDRNACNALFAELLRQSPQSLTLVASDAEGQLFASAPAATRPVSYADRRWFKKIVQTKSLVIDEVILGRLSGKYGFNLAYPILDAAGQFQGALTTQLDLHWLGKLLAKNDFPPGSALGLTDANKILFRYPDPDKFIGKFLPDFISKAMSTSDEGVTAGIGLSDEDRLYAFVRLTPPLQEMRVVIGLSRSSVLGPANHVLWRNLIWLSCVALFAMAAAYYGGDFFVVQPIKQLRVVTERLAAGDLTVRSGSNYREGELGLLSHSFDQMADSLQTRQDEAHKLLGLIQLERDKLKTLIDSMSDEVWFVDTNKKIIWANPAALRDFGLDSQQEIDLEKLLGELEIFNADGTPHAFEESPPRRALQGEIVWNLEVTVKVPISGEQRHRQASSSPVRDGSGNIIGAVTVVRDITERKQAEEDLKKERRRLYDLLDALPGMIYLKGDDYTIHFANQVFRQLFGDPQGKKCYEITAHRETPCPGCPCLQVLQTETPNQLEWTPPGIPLTFQVYNYPFVDYDGSKLVLSLAVDITARQQAAEALAASKSKLETALASMTDAVFISDAEGRFLDFNEAFATFHKFRNKEECPRTLAEYSPFLEVFLPNGEMAPLEQWAVPRALRGETATKAEYHLRRKDTGETWIGSFSFAPMRDNNGMIIGSVVSGRDITLSKRAEEDLRESQEQLRLLASQLLNAQEQERRRLASELHDELGHALLTLKLSLGAIAQKLPPEQESTKRSIQEQLDYITDVIKEVRRLYHNLSPGDIEDLGLTKALKNLIEDFAETQPDITWQVELPNFVGHFSLPVQTVIYRLLQESLTNIGKHAESTLVSISAHAENGFVHLIIGDDGQGFELSEVKKNPSRGLGLAAMRERLYSVGGSLEIKSQKGQGTRLTFIIPTIIPTLEKA